MCYDNYLAEKLPINKTKLPSVLQPDYNPVHAARHVDELKRVPDRDTSLDGRRKSYIDAFERLANRANMSCRELEQCLQDLLFRTVEVLDMLQLAIWFASHTDTRGDSSSLTPRFRPTVNEWNLYENWRKDWISMMPRDHKTRTSILRKAMWDVSHEWSDLADLYAMRWLRQITHVLNNPEIRHAHKLATAFAKDPHGLGHYFAVWFVHDTYTTTSRGLVNPMRGLHVHLNRLSAAKAKFISGSKDPKYQDYMTHRCRMADLEFEQSNPEYNNNGCCCCCKCCQKQKVTELLKDAHVELGTLLDNKTVQMILKRKKAYEKEMKSFKNFAYKVNTTADFDLVVTEESSWVGDPDQQGTEAYKYLIVELQK